MQYKLEERVEKFGENIIDLVKKVKVTVMTEPIIKQLIRSGTSVGANYFEANGASSRKDFINKIYISKKEVKETQHWLRMISRIDEVVKIDARILYKEAVELGMIFSTIITKTRNK
ncbi:MAG: four helix bundle protein [Candidatus Roizmanbacteria bacterium]|nr:four helix bundle protein [Candidatus Roizmanbacteria bacterium]